MKPNQIQIELPENVSDGIYSNLIIIGSSAAEFILDFAKVVPGKQKAKINNRVILPPQVAKSLINLLDERIKDYENKFGEIKIFEKGKNTLGF